MDVVLEEVEYEEEVVRVVVLVAVRVVVLMVVATAAMMAVVFVAKADLAAVAVNPRIAIRHRRVGGKIFTY